MEKFDYIPVLDIAIFIFSISVSIHFINHQMGNEGEKRMENRNEDGE